MKRTLLFFSILTFLLSSVAFAQGRKITGKVVGTGGPRPAKSD